MIQKENKTGYLFVLPALLVMTIFIVFSIFFLVRTSLYRTDITFLNQNFVGIKNYALVFKDRIFHRALLNNLVMAAVTIFFSVGIGFPVSVFLAFGLRGSKLYRTVFFIPTLLSNALIAAIFGGLLQYSHGSLNRFLHFLKLDILAQPWLSDPGWAYFSVMIISFYFIGMAIMYYTAELSTISKTVFESALIEGASLPQMMFSIIFPLVVNSHKTVTITMMLISFRAFERVFLLTGGGPGYATQIAGTYIYSFFAGESAIGNLGYASALSLVVLVISFIIAWLLLKAYNPRQESAR